MPTMKEFGTSLMAFGEGFQGRGQEFIAGLEKKKQAERQGRELNRKEFVNTVGAANSLIGKGQIGNAIQVLQSTNNPLAQGLAQELSNPQTLQEAMGDINNFVSRATAMGDLQGPEQISKLDQAKIDSYQSQIKERQQKMDAYPQQQEDLILKRKGEAEARRLRGLEAQLRADELRVKTETNAIKQEELKREIERNKRAREFEASNAISAIDGSISTVSRLLDGEGLEAAAGWQANFPTVSGSEASLFEATLETLQSQAFLTQVERMKGLGALSENEGRKLAQAIGSLTIEMPDKALRKELKRIEAYLAVGRGKLIKKFNINEDLSKMSDEELLRMLGETGPVGGR